MQLKTYLSFEGRCEEAIEFYRQCLGAEVLFLMRFRDNPESAANAGMPPGAENKILHSTFRIGDNTLSASDGQCLGRATYEGFSLSLNVPDCATAERVFEALSADGGQVRMPLAPTFFSPLFGTVVDRFGIPWIINAVS